MGAEAYPKAHTNQQVGCAPLGRLIFNQPYICWVELPEPLEAHGRMKHQLKKMAPGEMFQLKNKNKNEKLKNKKTMSSSSLLPTSVPPFVTNSIFVLQHPD